MDWFHCNNCFVRQEKKFLVSSCGHVLCESCLRPSENQDKRCIRQCCVCGSRCNYLPICDQMKPHEQMFFRDPVNLLQSRLEHITQIALFQRKQKERVMAYYRHKCAETERRLKEVTDQYYRQVSELKKENTELKKPLSQRRTPLWTVQTNGGLPRLTLPVAVTSPVTPRSRPASQPGSRDAMERFRHSRSSIATPPFSSTPLSSMSSLHEHALRTPSSINTPLRPNSITPNLFQFQLLPGSRVQSPQPWGIY